MRFAYTGATNLDTVIRWASTSTPATVTLTTPANNATKVNLSDFDTIAIGQSTASTGSTGGVDADDFGDANGQVTGTVLDATNATIAYKKVTLTGSSGVYFSTATSGTTLKPSMDVVTNASGVFNGVYAFFTKPGEGKITATAGTASKDAAFTTDDSADPFKVIAIDAEGTPGSTLVVTGKVTDFFGHPVPNTQVNLSTGSSTIGTLSDTTPDTNSQGVWSTTFISGSNQSGDVTLVATLNGQTTNKIPAAAWTSSAGSALTGLPEHGEYRDEATIAIAEEVVTLEATAMVNGGGRAFVSGMARANSNVDVYIKPVGADNFSLFDVVRTDAEGEFGTSKNIARSTQWLAKQGATSSTVELSSVQSQVTIGTRALGNRRAVLAGDGKPNAESDPAVLPRDARRQPGQDQVRGQQLRRTTGRSSGRPRRVPSGCGCTTTAPGTRGRLGREGLHGRSAEVRTSGDHLHLRRPPGSRWPHPGPPAPGVSGVGERPPRRVRAGPGQGRRRCAPRA